ncbi:hypothetical protein KA057_00270 [Candidatus Gracilibacteria bacterium]|nr:hypothetical protein [Candidatus Gracilibacteria bacterium]
MKKYIPILIITSLLFSACSIDWNGEKDKKIAELEKQTKNDIFKKNQECEKYKNEIEKEIKEYNWEDKERKITKTATLDSIFYSPLVNSCLYYAKGTSNSPEYSIEYNWIQNFLTKERITATPNFCKEGLVPYSNYEPDCVEEQLEFDEELKKLKGE